MFAAERFNQEEVRKGRAEELDKSHAQGGVWNGHLVGHGKSRSEASKLIFNWNVASHADGTEIMGGDGSVRMRQQTTARLWCITRRTVKQPVRMRLKQAWSLYSWHCGQVEPLCASSNDINEKRRELRHGAEHDSTEQHGSGQLVWTLGVGMADGPRALTWKSPCALTVAVRLWCGEMIVQTCTIKGSVGDVKRSVSCVRIKTWPSKSKGRRQQG